MALSLSLSACVCALRFFDVLFNTNAQGIIVDSAAGLRILIYFTPLVFALVASAMLRPRAAVVEGAKKSPALALACAFAAAAFIACGTAGIYLTWPNILWQQYIIYVSALLGGVSLSPCSVFFAKSRGGTPAFAFMGVISALSCAAMLLGAYLYRPTSIARLAPNLHVLSGIAMVLFIADFMYALYAQNEKRNLQHLLFTAQFAFLACFCIELPQLYIYLANGDPHGVTLLPGLAAGLLGLAVALNVAGGEKKLNITKHFK